ncbi:MAG: hypothetical protein QM687_12140 [Ferruginibacter sp.]
MKIKYLNPFLLVFILLFFLLILMRPVVNGTDIAYAWMKKFKNIIYYEKNTSISPDSGNRFFSSRGSKQKEIQIKTIDSRTETAGCDCQDPKRKTGTI